MRSTVWALALSITPLTMAQKCISLSGSKACQAFNKSSVSTGPGLVSTYPFLAFVSNTEQFDTQLSQYLNSSYNQLKYEQLLGCSNLDLSNTTDLYARYTTSVVCNAIVQNSKTPCSLSDADAQPLCADTCAQQAISEQEIIADNQTCSDPGAKAMDQIRADFTVCSLPSNALSGNCIAGSQNEPNDCGYQSNLIGLCSYCAKSSPNSTDTCCFNTNLTKCEGVRLPSITSLPPLFPTTTVTSTPNSGNGSSAAHGASPSSKGLSGGAIAGIVIGSVIGAALILGLIIFLCIAARRRRGSQHGSLLNQPSPPRRGGGEMAFNPVASDGPQSGYEVLPGGRIARMSALEGPSARSLPGDGAVAAGAASSRRRDADLSSSDDYGESPDSHAAQGRVPLYPPPMARRTGSLSSGSMLAGPDNANSPHSASGGEMSSPLGVSSQQSEQLPFFKDYYSQDEIHPNDKVATLWAYQPRAGDEFPLERGDMLKVVGIWDDGWATGIRISDRAENWESTHVTQRDSGVSNGSGSAVRPESSPPSTGEIKAFPLVCVCLPQHWRKTIDGDGSTDTASTGAQPRDAP